jgi:uncharacterized protein (DUF305 family)
LSQHKQTLKLQDKAAEFEESKQDSKAKLEIKQLTEDLKVATAETIKQIKTSTEEYSAQVERVRTENKLTNMREQSKQAIYDQDLKNKFA